MKKILVFLIGTFVTLIFIEGSIHLTGVYSKVFNRKHFASIKTNQFRILCIGNSHTAGSGVNPNEAYPAVLERELNKKFKNKNIVVFNGGLGNANTSVLLDELPKQFYEFKPHLLLIMAGEPNDWNSYGFTRFLQKSKNHELILQKSSLFSLEEWPILNHLRLLKILRILFSKDKILTEVSQFNLKEKMAYWKSSLEIPSFSLTDENANEKRMGLERYIMSHDMSTELDGRTYYIVLYKLYKDHFYDLEKAMVFMEKSIKVKNDFDMITYYEIEKFLQHPNFTPNDKQLKKLHELKKLAEKKKVNNEHYNFLMKFYPFGDLTKFNSDELALAKKELPGLSNITFHYIQALKREHKINDTELVKLTIEAINLHGPFCMQSNAFFRELKELEKRTHDQKLKTQIEKNFNKFFSDYPAVRDKVLNFSEDKIAKWIEYDISQMVQLAKDKKINVMIQGYHWLKGSQNDDYLNPELKNIALKLNVPFSDTRSYFIERITASGLNEDKFFALKYGRADNHPSTLGHQIIAKKIVEDLDKFKLLPF